VTKWSHVKSNRAGAGAVSPTVHATLLIALVALAFSSAPADSSFTAVDFAWRANGTDATTLTVAPGATVTFGYPDGANYHNVVFTGPQPASCENLPPAPRAKGWQGECTFADPGSYAFVCALHDTMTGSVVVAAPTPTPTPDPAATPGATATPTPVPDAQPPAQTTLAVKLAAKQRGTRVRGTVDVKQAATKLEVTVTARLKKARVRVGRWVKPSPAGGPVAFSVPLDARARRALRSARRLTVTVDVALTLPGGKRLTHTVKAQIRPR
jgi:plastocyanin